MSIPFAWMVSFIVASILNLWFVVRADTRVRPYNVHFITIYFTTPPRAGML